MSTTHSNNDTSSNEGDTSTARPSRKSANTSTAAAKKANATTTPKDTAKSRGHAATSAKKPSPAMTKASAKKIVDDEPFIDIEKAANWKQILDGRIEHCPKNLFAGMVCVLTSSTTRERDPSKCLLR